MKCEGCPIWWECDDQPCSNDPDCALTPSDMEAIKAAIAGEGRLWCLPPDVTEVVYGYRQVNIYGQDQGGE